MPVAVLKLPFLVQERICKEMNYSQLIVLSFCSLRMQKLIEFLNLSASKIRYNIQEQSLKCFVFNDSGTKNAMYIKQEDQLRKKKTQEITLGGVKVSVRFSSGFDDHGEIFYRIRVPTVDGTIERAFQEHINSLFHYSGRIHLLIKTRLLSNRLPSFQNVTDSFIHGERIDAKVLEDYLTHYPNHHSANIEAGIDGVVSEDSRIWNIERLCIKNQAPGVFLRRFTGQHLVLLSTEWKVPDLRYLLEEWVSNRAYQNLKTLCITEANPGMSGINYDTFNRQFRLQRYEPNNASRQPTHIHYNTEIINRRILDIKVNDGGFYEMKRSDGKRAMLLCGPLVVYFFVYDDME